MVDKEVDIWTSKLVNKNERTIDLSKETKNKDTQNKEETKPKSFAEMIKSKWLDGWAAFLGWTIPYVLMTGIIGTSLYPVYTELINPKLDIRELSVDIVEDAQQVSVGETTPGKVYKIDNDGNPQLGNEYHAPVLHIKYTEVGKTGNVYLLYRYSQSDPEEEWVIQRKSQKDFKLIRSVHTINELDMSMNYSSQGSNIFAYLVFTDTDERNNEVYCLSINKETVEACSLDELYSKTPYGDIDDVFEYQLQEIQKDISSILRMDLK